MNSLESLKQCKIVDLVLKGNPLRDRYREETVYVRYHFGIKIAFLNIFNKYHFKAYG